MVEFSIPQGIFDRWMQIREANGKLPIPEGQLKGHIDHSALLRRLMAGKEPFNEPPPLNHDQPWYELLEEGRANRCSVRELALDHPMSDGEPTLMINESLTPWRIIRKISASEYIARFSNTSPEYRLWLSEPNRSAFGWSTEQIQSASVNTQP